MPVGVLIDRTVSNSIRTGQTVTFAFRVDSPLVDPDSTLFFAAFAKIQSTTAEDRIAEAEVLNDEGVRVGRVRAVGADLDLTARGTGRIGIRAKQVFQIRVRSVNYDGNFSLRVERLVDLPEGFPPELRIGQTIEEAIAPAGDIDRFEVLDVPAGDVVNVIIDVLDSADTPLTGRIGSMTSNLFLADSLPRAGRWVTDVFSPGATGSWLELAGASDTVSPGPYRVLLQRIDPNPEDVLTTTFRDTLLESINIPGDIDEFEIDSTDDFVMVFLDGTSFGGAGLEVSLVDAGGRPTVGVITVDQTDSVYWQKGMYRLLRPRRTRLRAKAVDNRDTGLYRTVFLDVNAKPETADSMIVFGDTVIESMDHPGDVDAFTLPSHLGWLVAVIRGRGAGLDSLKIDVGNAHTESRNGTFATTGAFQTQTTTPLSLVVNGEFLRYSTGSGPYELVVYTVSESPEIAPAVLALGDSAADRIDPAGDLDRLTITADSGRVMQITSHTDVPRGVVLELWRFPFSEFVVVDSGVTASSAGYQFGAADTLRVVVRSRNIDALAAGGFTFATTEISTGPETAAGVVVPGDTVKGESYVPAGEVDEFVFQGAAGARYTARWRSIGGPEVADFPTVTLRDSGGTAEVPNTRWVSDGTGWSPVFTAPTDGPYLVTITGCLVCLHEQGYSGPYELMFEAINPAPERVDSMYVVGDTISGEGLNYAGDHDTFDVSLVARQFFLMRLRTPITEESGGIAVRLADSTGAVVVDEVRVIPDTGFVVTGGPYLTMTSGAHSLSVESRERVGFLQTNHYSGDYELVLQPINSDPETADSDLVVGDSVTTESIDEMHAIDTFTLTGNPGDSVDLAIGPPGVPTNEFLWAGVYDESDNLVAFSFTSASSRVARFAMPTAGTARIVVSSSTSIPRIGNGRFVGGYDLTVKAAQ